MQYHALMISARTSNEPPVGSQWSEPALDVAGAPLLTRPPAWAGLPIDVFAIPASAERGPRHFQEPMLQLATAGTGQRMYRCGASHRALRTAPHMIELYGAGFTIDHARWEGRAGRCIAIGFPCGQTSALLADDERAFGFQTRHEVFDERISRLVITLADEALAGGAGGRLFAEGLSVALMGLLIEQHASPRRHMCRQRTSLSDLQKTRIQEFIQAHLGGDLTIGRMADLLGMSAHQFHRRFRASFAASPHRYVLEQRIEGADIALRTRRDVPIAEIALEFGFATQAHFTETFRRVTGRTPAVARFS